ncbi:MAG TPA: glucokinase [Burkholderiaceae bacterium]|jgi:glucokinase
MSGAYPWLVADIGGTNARFGWIAGPGQAVAHVRVLPVTAHRSPAEAAKAYLADVADLASLTGVEQAAPRSAAFAVATAIDGDQIELTNAHWSFSRAQTQADLGLDLLLLLNDFEALALSLPRLTSEQLRYWQPAPGVSQPPVHALAVIGPGTGLGVAGVVPSGGGWLALPGEGGHATLAAFDDFEAALLAHVRRDFEHVSAERLLSGIGLPVLHGAVAQVLGGALAQPLSTEAIVERAVSGQDVVCERTIDAFCALLGGFAGNVALTLGSRGGVYVGGGIVPRLGERFFASQFRARFEAKGRFRSYMQGIPTALITDTLAALAGAAQAIAQHQD